jgi:signal peptidase
MAIASEVLRSQGLATRGRWIADLASHLFGAFLILVVLAAALFVMTGGKALVVRSGSMEPTIGTGDVALTTTVRADDVEVGDIITFNDPSRAGMLVTHRAIKIQPQGSRLAFVTKGDANTGVEKWLIDSDGTVGRVQFSVPRAGYVLAKTTEPPVRFGLIIGAGLLVAFAALRRIWSSAE